MSVLASQSENLGEVALAGMRDRVARAVAPLVIEYVKTAAAPQRLLMLNWLISTSTTLTLINPGDPPEASPRYLSVHVGKAPYFLDAEPSFKPGSIAIFTQMHPPDELLHSLPQLSILTAVASPIASSVLEAATRIGVTEDDGREKDTLGATVQKLEESAQTNLMRMVAEAAQRGGVRIDILVETDNPADFVFSDYLPPAGVLVGQAV
eukprot:1920263-Amphidinium_carterae.1